MTKPVIGNFVIFFTETVGKFLNIGYVLTPILSRKKIKDRGVEQSGSSLGS